MKKLLPILLVLFVFASCKDKHENNSGIKNSSNLTLLKTGPDLIPLDLAKKMIKNYDDRYGLQISKGAKKNFSINNMDAVWLELERLEFLIQTLKKENADGIRVYFAKFGDNVADGETYKTRLENTYSYHNTFIITGTKDSLSNRPDGSEIHYHQDFFDTGGAPFGFISSTILGLQPIPFKLAAYLVKNYDVNSSNISNSLNTRAVWLDLNKLELLAIKLKNGKADGVNIYFATYGDNVADEKLYKAGLEKDYSYSNTIILIGAKESQSLDTKGIKTISHLDSFTENETDGSAFAFFSDAANHGTLCPPQKNCGGTTF